MTDDRVSHKSKLSHQVDEFRPVYKRREIRCCRASRHALLIFAAMLCLGDFTWRTVPTANDWWAPLLDFPIPVRSAWRQWKLSQAAKDGRLVRLFWLRLLYRWLNALDLAVLRARLSVWRWLIRNRG